MSIPDDILNSRARSDARRLGYPIIERRIANEVYVIISPNGAMDYIVGYEMALEFIRKYAERHKDD